MAKVSMVNRELKRAKTVKKYAAKRAALKAQIEICHCQTRSVGKRR